MRNVENNPVGIFHLPLEIACFVVSEIKEKYSAGLLDAPLGFCQIVNLESKMISTYRIFRIGKIISCLPGEFDQSQVDNAIAQINCRTDGKILPTVPLKTKNLFIEFR